MSCLQHFITEKVLSNHEKQCLFINGCQTIKYESGTIKFTNYNKQIPIIFKIYANTECFLKRTNSKKGEYTIKNREHIPNSIDAKLVCINERFILSSVIFNGKDCIKKFIAWVLDKKRWTKKQLKNILTKD